MPTTREALIRHAAALARIANEQCPAPSEPGTEPGAITRATMAAYARLAATAWHAVADAMDVRAPWLANRHQVGMILGFAAESAHRCGYTTDDYPLLAEAVVAFVTTPV